MKTMERCLAFELLCSGVGGCELIQTHNVLNSASA